MADSVLPTDVPVESVGIAVRRIIRLLVDSGTSYSQISQEFQKYFPNAVLPSDNIRKFVQRRDKVNNSDTLTNLYRYIQAAKNSFAPFVRESVILHTDIFFARDFAPTAESGSLVHESYDYFVANAYRLLARMLSAEYAISRRAVVAIEGIYACFRASTRHNKRERIVVSRVVIGPKPGFPEIVQFSHHMKNSVGEYRDSDGFILGMGQNVVAISDIEFGHGLEMLTIRQPTSPRFKILLGLMLTLDTNGYPTCTRIVLKKMAEDSQQSVDFDVGPQGTDHVRDDFVDDSFTEKEFNTILSLLADKADTMEVEGTNSSVGI